MKLMVGIAVALALALLFRAAGGQEINTPGDAGRQINTQTKPVPNLIKRPDTRVLDGDTIVQGTTHYRLFGIDSPELGQTCADGWPAGEKSRGFLRVLIEGGLVVCDSVWRGARLGTDKYGRTLAVCTANGADLNQAMVRTGNARAYSQYSRAYVLDEIAARQSRAGMWGHDCQAPWDYRHKGKGK